jgi:hypothetical protein
VFSQALSSSSSADYPALLLRHAHKDLSLGFSRLRELRAEMKQHRSSAETQSKQVWKECVAGMREMEQQMKEKEKEVKRKEEEIEEMKVKLEKVLKKHKVRTLTASAAEAA